MKKQGKVAGEYTWDEEVKQAEQELKETGDVDKKGKRWYEYIPMDKIRDLLPSLKSAKDAKREVRYWTFYATWITCQEIFEKNKHDFRTRNQVDFLAHYIGTYILMEKYLKGTHKRSKVSLYLENQEGNNQVYDQLTDAKTHYQKKIDHYLNGIETWDVVQRTKKELIGLFDNPINKEKIENICNRLETREALEREKDRLKHDKYRHMEKQNEHN